MGDSEEVDQLIVQVVQLDPGPIQAQEMLAEAFGASTYASVGHIEEAHTVHYCLYTELWRDYEYWRGQHNQLLAILSR